MSKQTKAIGIVASDRCKDSPHRKPGANEQSWFHIRRFIQDHHGVLDEYDVVAPDGTADIIEQTYRDLGHARKPRRPIHRSGTHFWGVVRMAAQAARGDIDRILFFEDPDDLGAELPENYALLRNCNLGGKALMMNETANLWARDREGLAPTKPRSLTGTKGGEKAEIPETVVLIAHDGEKDRMARLVIRYHVVLRSFPRLLATFGTKTYLDKFLRATLPNEERLEITAAGQHLQDLHGARGGDVIIADEIFRTFEENQRLLKQQDGPIYHVLFFIDHATRRSPTLDTRVLLTACANPELRVNLIFNSFMGAEWLSRYIDE